MNNVVVALKKVCPYVGKVIFYAENHLFSLLLLWVRCFLGYIFFRSGMLKLRDWDTALYLFQYEHPVPFLPVKLAAVLGTGGEIVFPILMFIGLGTRLGALGLFFMTLLIDLTYMSYREHVFWMIIFGFVVLRGGGMLSCDYWISKRFQGLLKKPKSLF